MTSSSVRPIAILLMVLIFFSLMMARTKEETNSWVEDELTYAIRMATSDATTAMVDVDSLVDGNTADYEKIKVNLDNAQKRFEKTFRMNLGAAVNEDMITETNIPMVGYVGYSYITAVLENGEQTFPWAYTYTFPGATDDHYEIINFTLGETIYRIRKDGDRVTETVLKMSDLPENAFSTELSNEDFRTITIMNSVNEFLNAYSKTGYSLQAMNAGAGLQFNLGTIDYVGDDESKITKWSSVIDGPGFFAVVDMFDPQMSGMVRTFSFGGAEFISKY